ncbi:MAG: amidohydrolase [Bacillota bacterium]|nr:amidohydrolase [Bacillota bacterium]MDW7676709.1 amidohydrolase [Bacillota bacterium]
MDMILLNGNLMTMDGNRPSAEAAAIDQGRFASVGSRDEVLALKDHRTEVIDLKGKTVLPGFNDSHLHLLNYGLSLQRLDCSQATSVDEVVAAGQRYLEEHQVSPGEWLLGRGWNSLSLKEGRDLNRYDLDRISTRHPICLTRVCEHVVAVNTRAMELAGMTAESPQPAGGFIDREPEGRPLGIFRENARYLIYACIPDPPLSQIKDILRQAAGICAGYGITSIQSDDFEALYSKDYHLVLKAYGELSSSRSLPVRVYEQCLLPEISRLEQFLAEGWCTGRGDDYFKIGPLKLLTDGSLGARTALLSEPYADDPVNKGIAVFSQQELNRLVLTAHRQGMQVALHAIGDAAMTMCFDSFDYAQHHHYREDPRFGIIHLQITTEDLLERFAAAGVIAYAEPISLNNDLHMVEDRVGTQRAVHTYQYRRLVDVGVPVCLSTDCPVDSINPLKNIYTAVTRQDERGFPAGGWLPEQKLTLQQALSAYTMGSAYASFEETIKGSITPGKLADMAVLSEDPCRVPPSELQHISVDMTLMGGQLVYRR